MAKKLVGYFGADRNLPPKGQKRAMVETIMARLDEMGILAADEENEETKQRRNEDEE